MDPFVELARFTIQYFTWHKQPPSRISDEIHQALSGQRAATFVSIHTLEGELRGCKGTLEPLHDTVEEEVISNAISACSRDPRFSPIQEDELDHLEIHVDVLSAMEPIRSPAELDVRQYGVLVSTPDGRRGVLLPDIEGIDTVEDQIAIACRKAGIQPRREILHHGTLHHGPTPLRKRTFLRLPRGDQRSLPAQLNGGNSFLSIASGGASGILAILSRVHFWSVNTAIAHPNSSTGTRFGHSRVDRFPVRRSWAGSESMPLRPQGLVPPRTK